MNKEFIFTEGLQSPFSEAFEPTWIFWKKYRWQVHKFQYANPITEQAALNELVDLSEGDEDHAKRIVNRSISRNWKGFYKVHNPKKDQDGELAGKKKRGSATSDELYAAFVKRNGTEG